MNAVDKAVYDALAGRAALTGLLAAGTASIFQHVGPQNADPPYVVFNRQSRVPARVLGGGAVAWENMLYLVKGVTSGLSAAPGGTIALEIDAALDRASLTITGYGSMAVVREQDVDVPEIGPSGVVHYQRGALYRVFADPT